jgi:hypothetical protein
MALFTASAGVPRWDRDIAGTPPRAEDDHSASLTLTVRTCPAGYVVEPAGDAASVLCREPAGDTLFTLDGGGAGSPSASTGTSGDAPQEAVVRFSGLSGGQYRIRATPLPGLGGAFIAKCTSNLRNFDDYPFFPFARVIDGAIDIQLLPGEAMACDWYVVAAESDA